jgi:predicted nucleic acid-binding protein
VSAAAFRGPRHHRVPLRDALIAAAAQEAALGVLHYDHLAEMLSIPTAGPPRPAASSDQVGEADAFADTN